ncbi:helix-turn-helix transcriptional regulator [Streptomyces sp. BI20]|uniref:helix-turn-helix transcriptional regulator n=1 Tax=Streptomyces sp. BI20 TaxID=3403460 RepID=UPI003C780A76
MGATGQRQNWTFLTNHARVLVAISRDPGTRLRDVAMTCGLTERTVQTIVTDLETDGYLTRVRDGRRNRYLISHDALFRHPAEAGVRVAGLLALLTAAPEGPPTSSVPLSEDSVGPHAAGEPEAERPEDAAPEPATLASVHD